LALIRTFLIVFAAADGFGGHVLQKNFKACCAHRFAAIDARGRL